MTDLLDLAPAPSVDEGPPPRAVDAVDAVDAVEVDQPATFLRVTVAAGLAGAGAIHLAMVPSHMAEWGPEGLAFLMSAWVQLALALAILLRPRRWVLGAAIATSVLAIAAWAVTRTTGSPWGPESGHAEAATFIDITCVAIEAGVIALAALALWRPRATARWSTSALVFASVLPVAALLMSTVAIASPSASNHAAHAHGNEVTHAHGTGAADGHAHTAPDKLGFSLLGNGHHHAIAWHDQDKATQAELDRQLAITRQVAALYPTVAAAEAAGYRRAGPYSPGLGAHYTKVGPAELNADGIVDDENLRHPMSIIYDANLPNSKVAGFMYYSMSQTEPVGFVGTNDTWHTHSNVCVKFGPDGTDAPLGADLPITAAQCAAVGATLLPTTQWMVHVWSVPGYDNTKGGVFAEENPALACSDGTYFMLPSAQWPDNLMNVCRSKAPGEPKYTP